MDGISMNINPYRWRSVEGVKYPDEIDQSIEAKIQRAREKQSLSDLELSEVFEVPIKTVIRLMEKNNVPKALRKDLVRTYYTHEAISVMLNNQTKQKNKI